jgi:hypothetical protein
MASIGSVNRFIDPDKTGWNFIFWPISYICVADETAAQIYFALPRLPCPVVHFFLDTFGGAGS